jgi:uncharacterized membrane protein YhhN
MFKKITFTIVVIAIFITHIIFSLTEMSNAASLTNSILLAILVVAIGILFSIKD